MSLSEKDLSVLEAELGKIGTVLHDLGQLHIQQTQPLYSKEEGELDGEFRRNKLLFENVETILNDAYFCLSATDRTSKGKSEDDKHLVFRRLLAGYQSMVMLFNEKKRLELRYYLPYGAGAIIRHLDLQMGTYKQQDIPFKNNPEVADLRKIFYNHFPEREIPASLSSVFQ